QPPTRVSQTQVDPIPKNFNTGLSYRSKYYWRGQWFYGASAGIFLPYVSYANNDLYLYMGGEIGENLLLGESDTNESGFGEVEKDWQGLDFGVVKTFEISKDVLDISLGGWYFWYFKSQDIGNDDIDNSFADLRLSLVFKSLPLTPTLTYSHYIRSDSDYSKRTAEDYYITLAASKEFNLDANATFTITGDINYWNYASKEESPLYGNQGEVPSGISDSVFKFVFSWVHNDTTFTAGMNYAHVFHEKFDYTQGDEFDRNKFWSTIGIDKAF
ncbi:MAG: hypothetical protein KC478_11625, partial [Bacteriovoracaceae bacterium]|nr:hypothetical protein [Bacteriovoracaceae bacterium]